MTGNQKYFKSQVLQLAQLKNWDIYNVDEKKNLIQMRRSTCFLDIWYCKFKIVSCMLHPIHGNTFLVRDKCGMKEVHLILNNVRAHTDKGFYLRGQQSKK